MNNNLHAHKCSRCKRSYLSPDSNNVYCSSACEGRDKYEERYPYEKKAREKRTQKKRIAEIQHLPKSVEPVKEKITEAEGWLNKKPISDRPKQDLGHIMYRDTFSKYVPNRLKVMRG